jgi:hypothetical protein
MTINILTSNCFVVNCGENEENARLSDLQHWNIGLNLKGRQKNQYMILPGFTRSLHQENCSYEDSLFAWEFSELAVKTIIDYNEKFPYIFECIDKYQEFCKSTRYFKIYELFSQLDSAEKKMAEVVAWINSTNINKVSFAPCTSEFLGNHVISSIKETIGKKLTDLSTKNKFFSTKLFLNPNYAFIENTPWTPMFLVDAPPHFELGDRVINACSIDRKYIPFGVKGTVTAVADEYIEVIFDSPFFGGTTLNGRVAEKSGLTVNPLNLINLTKYSSILI